MIFAEYGERFYLRGTTAGVRLWGNRMWGLDAVARYHSARDSDDNSILEGLEEIDAGIDGGLALNVGRGPWKAQLAVYQDLSDSHDGLQIDLEAGRTFTLNPRLQLELEANATWADADFTDTYFGITPDQALRTGLPAYEAEAGMQSAGLDLGLNYSPGRHWLVRAQVGVARLLGDAADSPLVEDHGSATQPRAALYIGYRF
ncbi:MltA-interacting MipA family protein [Alloalcanivorax dieselolei B5]|uniref:MltA-interacting MipA family protein n=1 Tax=Alcanivorax dieselolei (strain DSM 16502 / CGMCC 1.3690 / MCCC 1A00001 / B-5) TaxID=930169 RepID=K0CEU8_ALCDB|nr:MltA-interacting MipA family protein [Alloalcanivorax dieselolei B5]